MAAPSTKQPITQLGEDCTKDFFDSLTPDEKTLFKAASISGSLLREVEDADIEYKEISYSRKPAAGVLPFIAGIEQYGRALDVFANSSDVLCPLWGAIRVVLHLAKEFGEYFDRLAAMLEDLGGILNRLPRCLRLYPDNLKLQNSVIAIYKDMFEFSTKAKNIFRVGKKRSHGILSMKHAVGFAAAFKIIWKPFDVQFGDIRDRITKNVTAIETEADVAEKELANQERRKDDVRWSKAEASQRLLAEFIDDQSMAKVNEWLSPANVATNHKAAENLRHGDSGTWFLQGETFQKWLKEENSFLWLHAIPGAGKTVLASSIINYLRGNVQSNRTGLAYFYCDYKDIQKQEPSKVLGTILATLGKQNKAVFQAIESFFNQQYKDTSSFTAEFDELLHNFSSFVTGHFESAIIIVDALDEAGTNNIDCLTHAFRSLHQQCRSLKILITSRNELPIARAFEDLPSTSIEQDDVATDISNFITAELSSKISQRRLKLRDPGLELVICNSLVEGSKGMFQWAKCQIEAICKNRNDKAIRAALLNLPKTLQETYIRILQRVEDDYPDDTETVRKILCWLVRGIRKPTLDELAEAVAVDPESDDAFMDFDAVDNDPEDILAQLGGLVTVSSDRVITLAHYSVKEFLVSDDLKNTKPTFWIGDNEIEAQLASVCLTYLCYEDFKHPELPDAEAFKERMTKYKLFHYATQAWAIHAQRSEHEGHQPEQVVDLTMRLLHSRDEAHGNFESWAECHQHYKYSKQFNRRRGDPLFVAAFFGLTEAASMLIQEVEVNYFQLSGSFRAAATNGHAGVVKVFLEYSAASLERSETLITDIEVSIEADETKDKMEKEEKPESDNRSLRTEFPNALYAAAANGHTSVISLLLSHGAPINARGGRDGTALQAAALEGQADAVKLLLEQGASHAEACKRYGTPLSAAAEKAHQRTFSVLLDYADPNGRGGWYSLPLVSAIVGKNLNIVRRLIEAGADINAIGGRHGGPLPAAAAFGMNDLVKELVDHGAKVNDDDDKASDVLYAASLAGHVSTVELLLDLGADVDAKGGRHQNALGAASSEGHFKVVETLLNAEANVEFFDEHWGNALQAAALRGHDTIVQLLADSGVDPNAPGGDKGTALVSAATNGHDTAIQTLLDLGVPSGATEEMTSALIAASLGGYVKTVHLLAKHGANVSSLAQPSKTASYCTPLQAAASKRHLDVVKLLISLGAEVNGTDEGWFGTALVAAVDANGDGKDLLVTTILDAGADVNEVSPRSSHFHGPALVHAVRKGDIDCIIILLDRGADINSQQSAFLSPLQTAVYENKDGVVDLLLERGADLNIFAEPLDVREDISSGLGWSTMTALQDAAWYGHEELVRRLVDLGADLNVSHPDAPFKSALQVAAYRGHVDTVNALLEVKSEVNERGGYFGSALQAAACRGELEVVRVLLEAGATANEIDIGHFHSALLSACMIDIDTNIAIVKLLVEHGADVNQKQKGPYPYPLHATSKFVTFSANDPNEILLEAGADPNLCGGLYGTAVQAAAAQGGEDSCRILLKNGANPNITGGFYNTPLQAAYRHGWFRVIGLLYNNGARNDLIGGSRAGSVMGQAIGLLPGLSDDGSQAGSCQTLLNQLLVHHKFDPNLEYGRWGGALQNVIMAGRDIDEVEMILDAGADVNKVGGKMGTAITAAAFQGDMENFDELMERGADVNLGNHRYPNAAFGAIRGGEREILKLLIEKGVKVKDVAGHFGSTAQCAAQLSHMHMLRMVLRAGAEINTSACGSYGSPLQAAASGGQEIIIRYLVRRGADVKASGGRHGGVLNAAVLRCHESVVELILKKGANVNEPGRVYGTPLQAAACEGRLPNVLVLLRYGADINHTGGKYGTAIQAACAGGRCLIVKLLVEKGADPNIIGGRYRTALSAAAIRGDEEIVRYLLEEAGATWSLVDRKKLGHVKSTVLDEADALLQRAREPKVAEEEQEASEATLEEQNLEKANPLPWNVESIPNACDDYTPPSRSKWAVIRELSFHTFSQRHIKNETASALSMGTEMGDVTPSHTDSGFFSRVNSNSSTTSKSRRVQPKPVSRTTTLEAQEEEEVLDNWDVGALNWVQV